MISPPPPTRRVSLREVAHSRAGEKGDDVFVSVIAHEELDYALLEREVTVDAVAGLFGPIVRGGVERYELPLIGALNFALRGALNGGRSRNTAFEESGKALSSLMLSLEVEVPAEWLGRPERTRAAGGAARAT